jgi:thymidylate synthase (FAD)
MIKATYIDHMGSDLSVVNAARVSFGKESDWEQTNKNEHPRLSQRDVKLVRYLALHKHFSPFGHAFCTWHVKAPVFVARQLVKHKFLRWNEISRRYVDDNIEFYEPKEWRGRSADKKQGSEGAVKLEGVDEQIVDDYAAEALTAYQALLEAGVAPEQARMVLPQSTMTEWYWSGSLDAFADMCNLRCKSDTQLETRLVADQIDGMMADLFPVSWTALRGLLTP